LEIRLSFFNSLELTSITLAQGLSKVSRMFSGGSPAITASSSKTSRKSPSAARARRSQRTLPAPNHRDGRGMLPLPSNMTQSHSHNESRLHSVLHSWIKAREGCDDNQFQKHIELQLRCPQNDGKGFGLRRAGSMKGITGQCSMIL
jgi:hypothetical protein